MLCPLGNDTSGSLEPAPGEAHSKALAALGSRPPPPGRPHCSRPSPGPGWREPTSGHQDLQVGGVRDQCRGTGGHGQGDISVQQLLQLPQKGLSLGGRASSERPPQSHQKGPGLPRRPPLTARRCAACRACCVPGPWTARSLRVRGGVAHQLGRRVIDPSVGPREGPVEGGHVDTLPGGVQQLQPGLGQGLGRRAARCRRQVPGDAFHEDEPAEEVPGVSAGATSQPHVTRSIPSSQAGGLSPGCGAGRGPQAGLGRAGLTPRSAPGRGLSGGPESRAVGAQARPKPRCCLLRAVACGARQRCWVWAPAAVEALGDARADPEGRAGPVGVGGTLGVCWDSMTPQRGGRGGGCDSTPGGRAAMVPPPPR